MEENEILETEKQKDISDSRPWLFKKGQSGNPKGRPKGKTLKEYARDFISCMTDEERQDFLNGLDKETIWKMAEGNPHSTADSKVEVTLPVPILGNVLNNDSNQESSEAQ